MITQQKIREVVNSIVTNYLPDKVILFGSLANDETANAKDIDLILIKNTNKPKHLRSVDLYKKLMHTKVPIDILVYTPLEYENEISNKYSFLNKALLQSKVLYDK